MSGIAGLFQNGAGGYWYDFSDTATVYESYTDESTNTPASFGGLVAYVKDKSGNANNLASYDTDSKKPTYGRIPADGDIRNVAKDTKNMTVVSGQGANWIDTADGYQPTQTSDAVPVTGLVALRLTHPTGQAYETLQSGVTFNQNTDVTVSMYLKYVTGSNAEGMFLSMNDGTAVIVDVKDGNIAQQATGVTASLTSASNGWYRLVLSWNTGTTSGRNQQPIMVLVDGNNQYLNVLSDTDTMLLTGYQAELASSASAVQVTGTTFDDVFEPTQDHIYFLAFDGEQGLSVSKNLGTTVDALSLFVSAKIDDPTYNGILVEYSDDIDNTGQAYRLMVNDSDNQLKFAAKGSTIRHTSSSVASYPETRLATAVTDISDDYIRFYKNGTLEASNTNDLGFGNFSTNKDLNIGCRNASTFLTGSNSLGFKGRIYQIVGVGTKMTDTNDLATINTAVAAKAGLTV